MEKDNNMMLDILVFLLTISSCTGFTLTTSSENATVRLDYTFTCVTTKTVLVFTRGSITLGTITGANTDGACVFNGGYNTDYTYTCNPTTNTYTVTIPGSYLTESLHGTKWKCNSPFGGEGSNTKILYVNLPISSTTLLSTPTDKNPVEVVSNRKQTFSCTTNAARPSSRIQWYLSITNITTSASPQPDVCNTNCSDDKVISSSVLTYTGNINDDGKILYCTAVNIEGGSVVRSSDKTIVIWYGPNQVIITPSTQSYTLKETENLNQIQCTADCKPNCTMTWSGSNIPAGTTSVLNQQNINRNQAGNYKCTASNDVSNNTSVVVNVVVQYGPNQVKITPSTQSYTLEEADNLNQIQCTADCKPDCTMTWNGTNLPAGTTSVLNLQNINRNQAGNYQCTASNDVSSNTSVVVNVVVQYGPQQVVIYPTTSSYTRNETLDGLGPINCTANCKPVCTSTWNGPNLPPGTTSELNIANINRNQAGNYQCTASNDVSSLISSTVYVVVNYQPTISNISNDKEVNENDTATITCTVESIPQSIIRWIFEAKELQYKYDGSLALNKIECLSMGRYTCQAVNMLGVYDRSVDVTVKCNPRINNVEFTIPSTITIKYGKMLNITAHIVAFPKPDMYWKFGQNGLYINASGGITNSFNINRHSSSLVKRNVVETDFGRYLLYAYNGVGSIQYLLHSFVVLQEKQPTSPTVVFVVCQTTSATVLWKPEMNGGSAQTFYVKFWSPSQSSHGTLTPVISDPGSDYDVQYQINNLVPETIYIFQIIARNVYGDSLSKSVNCTTNERQCLTSTTTSEQSGLFTAGISCLIIGLLSSIFGVSFVIYYRFRPQKRKPMSNNDYTEFKTCTPRPVVTDQYDFLNTTNMGSNDEHENRTDRNIHTYEECQPSNNTDRTYQNQNIQSKGATKKKEYIYDNMKI